MRRLLCLTVLILTVALLPAWLWPQWSMPFTDMFSQEIPFLLDCRRMLRCGDLPLWSWNTFMGDSFIGAYSFYTLTSPFVWLQSALPLSWVIPSFWIVLYMKFLLMAVFARIYLRQMQVDDTLANAGALIYTFSSFAVSNLFYWHFMEPIMVFPLFLCFLERSFQGGRRNYGRLALIAFLVAFVNFYFSVGSFIAAFIYAVFRLAGRKDFFRRLLFSTLAVLLGIAIAAPVLLTSYLYLESYGRMSTISFPVNLQMLLNLFRRVVSVFFPKLLEGDISDFNALGFDSATLWLPFAGLLPALLYIRSHRDSLSKLLILFLLCFLIMPLGGLFTLFRDPSYCRWSYALILMIVLVTVRYMQQGGKVSVEASKIYGMAGGVLALAGLCSLLFRPEGAIPLSQKLSFNTFATVAIGAVNLLLLYIWARRGSGVRDFMRGVTVMSVIATTASSLLMFHYSDLNNFDSDTAKERKIGRNISVFKPADDLKPFYSRIANMSLYPNYSLVTGTPTINGYSSCGPGEVLDFYARLNENMNAYPANFPFRHAEALFPLLSVDGFVISDRYAESAGEVSGNIQEAGMRDGLKYFKVNKSLPIGFAYDSYITSGELHRLLENDSTIDFPALMLSHLVIDDNDALRASRLLPHADTTSISSRFKARLWFRSPVDVDSIVSRRSRFHASDFKGTSRGWSCSTALPQASLMFFSVPADKGFSYYIDSRQVIPLSGQMGMTILEVPAGEHFIEARFMPRGLKPGLLIATVALLIVAFLFVGRQRNQ